MSVDHFWCLDALDKTRRCSQSWVNIHIGDVIDAIANQFDETVYELGRDLKGR